jgi:ribosome-associated translation inhibitor RaiA
MDINIEAPNHPSQEKMKLYYTDKLTQKYGNKAYITSLDVKVVSEKDDKFKVSIQTKPEGGTMLYADHIDSNEEVALKEVIRKLNVQIDKYKAHQNFDH